MKTLKLNRSKNNNMKSRQTEWKNSLKIYNYGYLFF